MPTQTCPNPAELQAPAPPRRPEGPPRSWCRSPTSPRVASHRAWCRGRCRAAWYCRAVWCCRCGLGRCAACCPGRSAPCGAAVVVAVVAPHDWTAKEEVSKKMIKEHVRPDGKRAAARGTATQSQRMVSRALSGCVVLWRRVVLSSRSLCCMLSWS